MFKKFFFGIIVTLSYIPNTFAYETDQQQSVISATINIDYASPIGQSFVPQADLLSAIKVNLLDSGGFASANSVFITLHENGIANPAIAQTETVFLEDCFNFEEGPGCGMGGGTSVPIAFKFPETVNIIPGETYVFQLQMETGTNVNVAFSYSDTYAEGAYLRNGVAQAGDLAFETLTPPAPSILVSAGNTLYWYNYEGEMIRSEAIEGATSTASARDLIQLMDGNIAVFNGVFTPSLSVLNTLDNSWSHHNFEGWSIVNNVSYGGIAADSNYIYVGDLATAGTGAAKGLVRFANDFGSVERFFSSYGFLDVTLGDDGLLYALQNTYGDLVVIDPASMTIVSEIDLGHSSSSRAVVADADSNIYFLGYTGLLTKLDSQGNVINTLNLGYSLADIDIQGDKLLVSRGNGQVYLLSTELEQLLNFTVPANYGFVAFGGTVEEPQEEEETESLLTSLQYSNDWNSGYCANLTITNITDAALDWTLALSVEGTVTNLWNGTWSQSGSVLSVSGVGWNSTLQAGETTSSVGFCANR